MLLFLNCLLIVTIQLIPSSDSLYPNPLTYRFTEYVVQNGPNAGWDCTCPKLNEDNLCVCSKEGVSSGYFVIESPYMAILIQADLDGPDVSKIKLDDWDAKPVQLNMAGTNEPKQLISEYIHGENEEVLKRIKLMPKDNLSIRYLRSNSSKQYRFYELSLNAVKEETQGFDVVIVIPGWQSQLDKLHTLMVFTIHSKRPKILVDWLDGNQYFLQENERIYEQVVANTVYVGYHLGEYIRVARRKRIFRHTHIIGFDIGSYVAHFAAKYLRNFQDSGIGEGTSGTDLIDRITALDPPRYLFEDDPLSVEDAKFVEIYHSNVGYEKEDGSFDLAKSVMNRRFGESRQLGHSSVYLNLLDQSNIYGGHRHPQCNPGDGLPSLYGCSSLMAARFLADSINNKPTTEFQGHILGNPMTPLLFGFLTYGNVMANGMFHVKYDKNVCNVENMMIPDVPDMLTDEILTKFILPNESISHRRERVIPPIEDPVTLNKVAEENPNCGQVSNLNYSSRVYEGRNTTDNQFPFVVCIEPQKATLHKYKYILFDNKFYERPAFYQPSPNIVSRYDRLSNEVLTDDDGVVRKKYYDVLKATAIKPSCTGSLIDSINGWIVTAAHCFGSVVNEINIRLSIGSADCNLNHDKKFFIKAEMDENRVWERNIFVHPNTMDVWDETINKWYDDMAATACGRILTWSDLTGGAKKAAIDEFKKYSRPGRYSAESLEAHCRYEQVPPTEPMVSCRTVDIANDVFGKGRESSIYKSDITLVKIPLDKLKNYPNSNGICYKSVNNFDIYSFNQFMYYTGYGNKGLTPQQKTENDRYQSWLTELRRDQVIERYNGTIMGEYPSLGYDLKHDTIEVLNTDQTNDEAKLFIGTITCQGDSGGPHFVYANSGGAKYTLQIGVHGSGGKYKTFGDIIVYRGKAPSDLYCVLQLRYNVYAKRYFKNPGRFTMISFYVDWIDKTIKDNNQQW